MRTTRKLLVGILAAAGLATASAVAYSQAGPGYGPGYGFGYSMGIGMLLFWGLIIFAIVSLISGLFSKRQDPSHPESQTDDALQILKKRYARGDIDKAQFDAMRRDLNV